MTPTTPTTPISPATPAPSRFDRLVPVLLIPAVFAGMIAAMLFEGRIWWCACGSWALWKSDVWSSHCSQHVADPYSISHISHGLLFWCLFAWLADRLGPRYFPAAAARFTIPKRLLLAVLAAAVWEVAENSTYVIERYRTVTMSLDYLGDSIINSTGDVLCCVLGFEIARRMGIAGTLLLFVAFELILLWTIKDNLSLNVLMLLWPVKAIKEWQSQGHLPPSPAG